MEELSLPMQSDIAIVTGAAQGQGESHARLFVERGCRVVIADINSEKGHDLAHELGEKAIFVAHDVTDEQSWLRLVECTERHFGPLTVLVNNAGVDLVRSIEETSLDDYRRITDVNQVGVFLGIKSVIDSMEKSGRGSIINISSIGGLHTTASSRIAYVASKHAVRGMTKTAAAELAPRNIRVNSVHPGFVDTAMFRAANVPADRLARVPLGRPAELREVSELVAFLASSQSSYITATEHLIDGGYSGGF